MDIEQPELPGVGVDAASLTLNYSWERGWSLVTSSRLSGSERWRRATYGDLDAAELHSLASDTLAEILGLI